ncbi:DUF4194 domain-containing protein [Stenotrophomonas indicatrix]|uniref:DUF4194 domain-containing protein n=1 Tax=Stenotrophomonas indicatrix TaxID=2045451 RepID=UPI0020049C37|nr:DUF4194 domain-containing protein [Stenotrophomonas indicatrix]MCK6231495.1 DUF4194 domain-containing protein [Stenotrophomonas indicatrix]
MISWDKVAEQSQLYVADDLRKAGYRLVMEQVIYGTDARSRGAYEILTKYLASYRELLANLGMAVIHNPHMSYIVAVPNQYIAEKMRLGETRLALVLRRLYDDKMYATEIVAGEAHVTVHDLEAAYKDLMGKELPENAALRDLLAALKRYGLVRLEEAHDEQPFTVVVRPGIVDVLGETALLQLAAHAPNTSHDDEDE